MTAQELKETLEAIRQASERATSPEEARRGGALPALACGVAGRGDGATHHHQDTENPRDIARRGKARRGKARAHFWISSSNRISGNARSTRRPR